MQERDPEEATRIIWITVLLVVAGNLFGGLISNGFLLAIGIPIAELQAKGIAAVPSSRIPFLLAMSQVLGYLLPGLLASWLLFRHRAWVAVRLLPLPHPLIVGLGLLAFASTMLLTAQLAQLNAAIELADWQNDIEQNIGEIIGPLVNREGVSGLLVGLVLIAVLPAIGEELVFRGLLQPALITKTGSPQLGVWLTGLAFGIVHMQFAGMLPRMFLGAVLGSLAYYSRRLWVPIVAHMAFNGLQVIAVRAGALEADLPTDAGPPSPFLLLAGCVAAGVGLYFILPRLHPKGIDGGIADSLETGP